MISSKRAWVCAVSALAITAGSGFALAQDEPRIHVDRKTAAFRARVDRAAKVEAVKSIADETGTTAGLTCASHCDFCHIGTPFWSDCLDWQDDGECDCGCQFADNSDCGSNCSCPSSCDWCWCNTSAQSACPTSWNGDGECDCACQFADVDCGSAPTGACCTSDNVCSVRTQSSCTGVFGAYSGNGTTCGQTNCAARCAAGCEACWEGTPFDGNCDPAWEGDGLCDCGCQFVDPDCGPKGACCAPLDGQCAILTEATCELYFLGVFQGVATTCLQADCDRCGPGCIWCWKDTFAEHACLPEWEGDGDCDCGCQFTDRDCTVGVCGNLVCEEDATSCVDDCKDLRAFAEFQNCFNPGNPEPPQCFSNVYTAPLGVGLEDYGRFNDFLSGP